MPLNDEYQSEAFIFYKLVFIDRIILFNDRRLLQSCYRLKGGKSRW
jgi:hypothetical protein